MSDEPEPKGERPERFTEGVDYYFDGGLLVMTADYLLRRGYCCGNGCRNCPYDDNGELK